jgi:hypothetical protein
VKALPREVELESARKIILHTHPSPVEVAYESVLELLPNLYKKFPNVTFFVHVGVHGGIKHFQIEKRGRRGPYTGPDVHKRSFVPHDDRARKRWTTMPEELWTNVDVDGIVKKLRNEG